MKKHYNTPVAKSIVLDTESSLLAESIPVDNEPVTGPVGSNKRDLWDKEDRSFLIWE